MIRYVDFHDVRRTILEFVLPGDKGLAWWDGLTRWLLNPELAAQG